MEQESRNRQMWLCTDPRTSSLVLVGTPVAYACCAGCVEAAEELVRHGAWSHATNSTWCNEGTPPLLAAAENERLEAMQWLVEEQGHDIRMLDSQGRGILGVMAANKELTSLIPGVNQNRKACIQWAKRRLKDGKGRPRQPTPQKPQVVQSAANVVGAWAV